MIRHYLRYVSATLICTIILGCAAAGVPSTSDPEKKISYAYQLMSMGGLIPAKKLLEESLDTYVKNKDVKGQINANFAFGNYYRH